MECGDCVLCHCVFRWREEKGGVAKPPVIDGQCGQPDILEHLVETQPVAVAPRCNVSVEVQDRQLIFEVYVPLMTARWLY